MPLNLEHAALVTLLRHGERSPQVYAELLEETGSALTLLQQERLVTDEELEAAAHEISTWEAGGIRLAGVLDPAYPENLRAVHDRPPAVFVAGNLLPADARSVAVIGSRRASPEGITAAQAVASHLVETGFTVLSGLAVGIDTAAHRSALAHGGRTVAVVGTGLRHTYPSQNARLQRRIARDCAVISQFWPDTPPSRRTFPMRNAVMSGMALATVIIEASQTSGARVQSRLALAQGRPVFLLERLLEQQWARELATRPGTHVVREAHQISSTIERLTAPEPLVG